MPFAGVMGGDLQFPLLLGVSVVVGRGREINLMMQKSQIALNVFLFTSRRFDASLLWNTNCRENSSQCICAIKDTHRESL